MEKKCMLEKEKKCLKYYLTLLYQAHYLLVVTRNTQYTVAKKSKKKTNAFQTL